MKKLLTALVLLSTMMLTLTGCFQTPQTEQNKPETNTEVKDEVTLPPAETPTAATITDWDPNKYQYDNTNGVLVDLTDNNKVLYTNPDLPDTVLHIQGMEGDKIIVWETGMDNSPGPCYTVWTENDQKNNIKLLDLKNLVPGLQPYKVPQYKYDLEKEAYDKCDAEVHSEGGLSTTQYINNDFKFMVDIPPTWNRNTTEVENVETARIVTISSESHKERFIKLLVIDQGDNMPPLQLIGETRKYMVYVDDSMNDLELSDELKAEYEKIYASFSEMISGKYLATSYYGYALMFEPRDEPGSLIYFTNQIEAFNMLKLKKDQPLSEDCVDYSGSATVGIKNLVKNEEQTHTPTYNAELADIFVYFPPECDVEA